MKRIGTMTLGCKVNHTETQAIEGLFQSAGYEVVPFEEAAEVYLINTCSVTHLGERKSRQSIRRAIRKAPNATIVVTGCYAQSAPGEISGIEGVDLIVGTQDRHKLIGWVKEQQQAKKQQIHVGDILAAREFEDLPAREEGRSRAFFKVQEGCNQFCTYCIIPYTRGPLRSRSLEAVQREAENLSRQGFREVILTGIHLGAYGLDLPEKPSLADLMETVLKFFPTGRVRLGSLESVEVSPKLLNLIAENPRICRQLHLPLQSGTDKILKGMGRPYTVEKFRELLARIRENAPDIAVTTDIIVGFPGESEADFESTLEAVRGFGFSGIHVFPYSPRRGTPAAGFKEQVSEPEKRERVQRLQKLADEMSREFQRKFIGREVEVLWEEPGEDGKISGWSSEYIRIYGEASGHESGSIERLKVTNIYRDGLWGEAE